MKILFTILLGLTMTACIHSEEADLVVHNARIHSMDEGNTSYQAMAIRDGRIVELGPEQQILNRYGSKKHFDAAGRTIYPDSSTGTAISWVTD